MRRILLALLPWMVASASGQAGRPVTVAYTHLGTFQEAVRFGDECFAPVTTVQRWGWDVRVSEGEADIVAEGRTIRVVARTEAGKIHLPLISALQQLGARMDWSEDGSTLRVRGMVRNVEVTANALRVDASLAFRVKTERLDTPSRLVFDLEGAWLDPKAKFDLPPGIRVAQRDDDTVRLVIERPGVDQAAVTTLASSRTLQWSCETIALREKVAAAPAAGTVKSDPASAAPTTGDPELTPPPTDEEPPLAPPTPSITASAIMIDGEHDNAAVLAIPLSGPMAQRPSARYEDPLTITITLPGVAPAENAADNPKSRFVADLAVAENGRGALIYTLALKRALGFELSLAGNRVVLRLVKPKASDGKLAGKVVVVDAGHGGHDTGARWQDAVREKDLTLKVAKQVGRELSAQGAAVIMTRSDDTFIPLRERPAIANRSKADFFVSVHINSNKVADSRSGSITFYHKQDPLGMLLAECIQNELAKVTGLPDIGTWSDTRIYSTGFAVLRYSEMPAVLLELGFINHATDRKAMQAAKFHEDVAKAVVRGLKVYSGDGR